MASLLARTGKAVPMLSKYPKTFAAFGIVSKRLSDAVNPSGRHILALNPVVQDRNKMHWNKRDLLHVESLFVYDLRICATNAPNPLPSSPDQPPAKKQVEKAFFRFVAFFWDYGGNIFAWSGDKFKTYVIDVPSVQFYWKRFHEKMEQSKKNF